MWLLESNVREKLEAAIAAGVAPTVEQQAQYEATYISALSEGGSQILSIAGNTAEISIKGVLTQSPSFLAMLFGGGNTTYSDITSALAEAEQNPNVKDITFAIDSPGGSVDGLFDTLDIIKAAHKPITAVGKNMVASAAYALASQADKIVAANKATMFGSIGIMGTFRIDKSAVSIASTNAPKKNPDASTPEGVAMIREHLDAVHELFVEAIADGRDTTIDKINADFGQGGVLLAEAALSRGMIDSITKTSLQSVNNTNQTKTVANGGDNLKVNSMDPAKLQAEHPDVFAAVVAIGVTQERDRVGAHLTMGKSSGDMETAVTACLDGTEMTGVMTATYLSATANASRPLAIDSASVSTVSVSLLAASPAAAVTTASPARSSINNTETGA
jgi:ClpP class serine protease